MPRKKAPQLLNMEEAAAHLGITPEELNGSRIRGLPPGNLGFKDNFVLVWRASDLDAFKGEAEEVPEDAAEEDE